MPRKSTVHPVTAIGIDMGKTTLHMVGLDSRGAIVLREKVSRGRIASRLANVPPCLIGIEAGMATNVARELAALGHDVKQVPPTYAKPFRQGHKNDFQDAHAVAEAVQRYQGTAASSLRTAARRYRLKIRWMLLRLEDCERRNKNAVRSE